VIAVEKSFFTTEELKQFDGSAGKPSYIAVRGKVYDVSHSDLWIDGDHQGMHSAGADLTKEIPDAPHDEDVLTRFPLVGELRD
jgi:predicted heme/steroid binding protein